MEEIPGKGDKHFEEMTKKASRRMYILRVCKHYGLSTHQLDLLFNSLIVSFHLCSRNLGWSIEMVIQATDQILKQQYRTETRSYGQEL
jgi:hypothetical protein